MRPKKIIFRFVRIADINVDPRYQRFLSMSKVREMVRRGWDPIAAGEVKLNIREDDKYWLFDGQHRMAAAELCGEDVIRSAIHFGMTAEEEAEAFVKCNTNRGKPSPLDRHRAMLFYHDPVARAIESALNRVGAFAGASKSDPDAFGCVASARRMVERWGAGHFRDVVSLLANTWPGDASRFEHIMVTGMSLFLREYPDINMKVFAERLHRYSCDGVISAANGLSRETSGLVKKPSCVVTILVKRYNSRLKKGRLPMHNI